MNNISTPAIVDVDDAVFSIANGSDHAGSSVRMPLLRQYISILLRRRYVIIAAVLLAVGAGVVMTMLATRLYVAQTTIEIAREDQKVVNIEGVEPGASPVDQEFYETQYGLLRSRSLAERVARAMRLPTNDGFFIMYGVDPAQISGGRDQRLKRATDILLDNIDIQPARLSRLVDVRFSSPDPVFAAQVSNTWAENFIQSNLERRFEAASYARDFLQDQLTKIRSRLEGSERAMVGFAGRQGIVNLETTDSNGTTSQRSLASDEIVNINRALAEATADRIAAQTAWQQTRASDATDREMTNPTIASLRERRAEVAAERAQLLAQFEPAYPPAQALAAQLQDIDQSLAREQARIRSSAESRYREALGRENQLEAHVTQLRGELVDLSRRSIEYNILQRDVDTNRQLYDGLLQRYKEIGIAGGVGTNNVSIVDRADTPVIPAKPRPLVNIALAMILGLGVGVVLAFALEQLDETIRDPESGERLLGVPFLGTLPRVKDDALESALEDPKSAISEAYSAVRTSLSFTTAHGVPRVLAVTSTKPSEGKSTTSFAIAQGLARQGRRVLLVDGDMRNPSVHRMLSLPNESGLSSVLSGNLELGKASQAFESLAVLTAGPRPPDPPELLSNSRLLYLTEEAKKTFDHIVIDGPPVMGLADAPMLANQAEAVLYVLESNATRSRAARHAIDRLRQAHATIVGIVLTKFDPKKVSTGYEYEYGYDYGHKSSKV